MRSGGCAVQQALAPDAAAVMRQAVSVARRRGHAQVTPLHVASAMLADAAGPGGLLRAACLRSRPASHPLQCKALELCFNVALNRLATASGGGGAPAVFWSQQQRAPPALSNALAAAFKRAQANQRRGGGGCAAAEGQQQAAGKIELEQLVISILDDPGVSRVMHEAGFSSAEVKANVEKSVSISSTEQSSNMATSSGGAASPPNPSNGISEPKKAKLDAVFAGDAARVLDCMASGRNRCVVVVGESAAAAEGVVKAVMDQVSKGELRQPRHERLKNLQFVPLSLASFKRMQSEEVESRAGDLRALVRQGSAAGKGVVIVLEDLGYAAEAWAAATSRRRSGNHCYSPVEHAVTDLCRLVRGGEHNRFWLLAYGTHASYATCAAGQPSLEAVLEMHRLEMGRWTPALSLGGSNSDLAYCSTAGASMPLWFRRCHGSVRAGSELTLSFSSPAASPIYGGFPVFDPNPLDPRQLWLNYRHDPLVAESHDQQQWPGSPNNPGSSNSVSITSGGAAEAAAGRRGLRRPQFTELTAENLKVLCAALEARVPRHRDLAPGIASAVLQRRSGVTTRTARRGLATWLVFQGTDTDGKTAVARELARLVFGSYDDFATVGAPTEFTEPVRSGSSSGGELSLKRPRSPEKELDYVERFHEAVCENPHRVLLIDGVEHLDNDSEAGIKSSIATGTVRGCDGVVASLEDAIVVLSCEQLELWSRAPSPRSLTPRDVSDDVGSEEDDDGTQKGAKRPRFSLDLNACAIDNELEEGSWLHGVEIRSCVDGVFMFQN